MKIKRIMLMLSVCAVSAAAFSAAAYAEGEVAQIGDVKYQTLQQAVNAVDTGETIELIGDLNGENVLTETVQTDKDDNFILDLNGYTIDVTKNGDTSLYAIDNYGTMTIKDDSQEKDGLITARGIKNFGTMKITDGTIESRDSNGGGACVWNEGNLFITGGTFKVTGHETEQHSSAIPITNSGGKADITGGIFESKYAYLFSQNGGEMTVSDITLTKPDDAAEYWTTVKCYPGSIVTLNNVTIQAKNSGGIEVAGGTAYINDCNITATGENESSSYNLTCVSVSSGGTANINGGKYDSFKYGFYVFNSGGTINVEGDVTASASIAVLKADYNGSDGIINVKNGTYTGNISESPNTEINIMGGKYSIDVSKYLMPDTAIGQADGMYNVISSENKATEPGTYKTAVGDDDLYDQMSLFEVNDISGNITYNVSTGTTQKEFTYDYANVDGSAKIGLVVIDIPSNENVTVELQGGQE